MTYINWSKHLLTFITWHNVVEFKFCHSLILLTRLSCFSHIMHNFCFSQIMHSSCFSHIMHSSCRSSNSIQNSRLLFRFSLVQLLCLQNQTFGSSPSVRLSVPVLSLPYSRLSLYFHLHCSLCIQFETCLMGFSSKHSLKSSLYWSCSSSSVMYFTCTEEVVLQLFNSPPLPLCLMDP